MKRLEPASIRLVELLLQQGEDYAIFLMDREGTITDWFTGAEHVFGFTAAEMIGQPATRLFNRDDIDRGACENEFQMARSTGRAEDDRWHVRKDGSNFWGSGVLFALKDPAGEIVGFVKAVRNRTDVKIQTEALENQLKSLSTKYEQQTVFLSTLVHELRNPLAPLANALEIIRRQGEAAQVSEGVIQIIDRQLAVLQRLVDDLMDMIRVGAGKVDLQLEELDLRQVARIASNSVEAASRSREQEFQLITVSSPVLVEGDPERLQQVFMNLLTNAIKYTPRKGRITFNITTEGGYAVARIDDTGVGMDAEILPKVFELFTQEDTSRKISLGGLGLGLAVVRDLVDMHGGTIQARSDGRDKGSTFTVHLPLSDATQP